MAVFRAVENGFAVVRQANHGQSLAADPYGNLLASASFFGAANKTLVAYLPTRRAPTVYNRIGDAFAYVCVLTLTGLIMYALLYRRKGELGGLGFKELGSWGIWELRVSSLRVSGSLHSGS